MKKSKLRKDQYSWITGEKLMEVAACVEECGAENVTVDIHDGTYEDGTPSKTLQVRSKSGEVFGTFNESFPCPPFCPPD